MAIAMPIAVEGAVRTSRYSEDELILRWWDGMIRSRWLLLVQCYPPHINDISVCLCCYSISFFGHVKYLKGKPNLYQELSTQPCEHHRPKFRSYEAAPSFSNLQNLQIYHKKKTPKKFKFSGLMVSKLYPTLIIWILLKWKKPSCYTLPPLGSNKNLQLHHHGTPSSASEANSTNCPAHLKGAISDPENQFQLQGDWKKNWPFGGVM